MVVEVAAPIRSAPVGSKTLFNPSDLSGVFDWHDRWNIALAGRTASPEVKDRYVELAQEEGEMEEELSYREQMKPWGYGPLQLHSESRHDD